MNSNGTNLATRSCGRGGMISGITKGGPSVLLQTKQLFNISFVRARPWESSTPVGFVLMFVKLLSVKHSDGSVRLLTW